MMEEIKLYAMTCGWITMPAGFFLSGQTGNLAIPIPSYFIEHPKGTILFDTGLETALQSKDPDVLSNALGAFADLTTVQYHPGEEVSARLEKFGIDPKKINFIINSHLHFDHCGGNAAIPNARWILQKREWIAANNEENIAKKIYTPHQYDLGHDRIEVDDEYDIFQDGTLILIPTYGHTDGHQSLKVKLGDKTIVLTADACYLKHSLEKMALPDAMVVSDPESMLKNYKLFKSLQEKGAKIIFGHDPTQSPTLTDGEIKRIHPEDIQ